MVHCPSANRTLELTCPQNYTLSLQSVLYGRDDNWICTDSTQGLEARCHSLDAAALVKTECEGQTRCTYTVDENSFGGMCSDVEPYFRVNYSCIGKAYTENF